MKCTSCKYYNGQRCSFFKQDIKVKKSCWAFVDRLHNAIVNAIKR